MRTLAIAVRKHRTRYAPPLLLLLAAATTGCAAEAEDEAVATESAVASFAAFRMDDAHDGIYRGENVQLELGRWGPRVFVNLRWRQVDNVLVDRAEVDVSVVDNKVTVSQGDCRLALRILKPTSEGLSQLVVSGTCGGKTIAEEEVTEEPLSRWNGTFVSDAGEVRISGANHEGVTMAIHGSKDKFVGWLEPGSAVLFQSADTRVSFLFMNDRLYPMRCRNSFLPRNFNRVRACERVSADTFYHRKE